jgi:ATP-dependent Clp protease ATP-binding subunit ClpA
MIHRFVPDSRRITARAHEIAGELGAPAVEAEHVLLAVAEEPASPAGQVLAEAGLDVDGLQQALEAETIQSLAAVGVALDAFDLPPAEPEAAVDWATSAKLALRRAMEAAVARGDKRIEPPHLVLGVLQATTGKVPRALRCAGVDRTELSDRVAATLSL